MLYYFKDKHRLSEVKLEFKGQNYMFNSYEMELYSAADPLAEPPPPPQMARKEASLTNLIQFTFISDSMFQFNLTLVPFNSVRQRQSFMQPLLKLMGPVSVLLVHHTLEHAKYMAINELSYRKKSN